MFQVEMHAEGDYKPGERPNAVDSLVAGYEKIVEQTRMLGGRIVRSVRSGSRSNGVHRTYLITGDHGIEEINLENEKTYRREKVRLAATAAVGQVAVDVMLYTDLEPPVLMVDVQGAPRQSEPFNAMLRDVTANIEFRDARFLKY